MRVGGCWLSHLLLREAGALGLVLLRRCSASCTGLCCGGFYGQLSAADSDSTRLSQYTLLLLLLLLLPSALQSGTQCVCSRR